MSLLISENKENFPILIVDKIGDLGFLLAKRLSESSTVVLVTEKSFKELENVIYIPYRKRIPKIPDNLYSHIFVIDDGEDITLEALPSFFKKAQLDHAVFSFCTSFERENLPAEIFEYSKSRISFLGDVFPQTGFFPKSYVNRFLTTARNRGRIDVPQDGMATSYPIFLEDAISGLLEASFGTSREKIYYIFPKEGVTLLSLAHNIQKKNPEIKVDFTDEEVPKQSRIVREGKFLYKEDYNLDEKIRNLNLSTSKTNVEKVEKSYAKKTASTAENLKLVIFALFFFLFLPLITTLVSTFLGYIFLDSSKLSFENSKSSILLAKSSFSFAQKFSKVLLYETSFLSLSPLTSLADSIEKGKTKSESISGYYEGIDLLGESKINEGISKIKDFLVFAQADSKSKYLDKDLANFITESINVWPQIVGADSAKSYLILFQNDNSLKGSGGVIEDFGIMFLENGKISDFKIYNSKDLDKNLKGHVEPPFAIRRYSSLSNFHLMDAGFDTDFGEAAKAASFFVNLETGSKIDGVFRLNNQALGELLGKGDLKNQNITDLANSLKGYFEGKNLAKVILTKEFVDMLKKKDISISFNDKSIDNTFVQNSEPTSEKTILDALGLFETDFDQTDHLSKEISQKVEIKEDGVISSVVDLNLKNSQSEDTKKYLRFLVPSQATLKKVEIDGQETDFTDAITDPAVYEAKDFKAPKLLEIERSLENGKGILGFLVGVPKNKSQEIKLTVEYPGKSLSGLSSFSYNLHFLKQPGANSFPFNFSISFPQSFKIYSEPKVSKTVDSDFDLTFNFTK